MVASLLHPLNIFILGLGGGFLIPLLNRLGKAWVSAAFLFALIGMTLISGVALFGFMTGGFPIEIFTGGSTPPYAINLRLGMAEGIFCFGVNLVALLGAGYFVRAKYAVMLIYLIMVMGIQGMVMTRDLFNAVRVSGDRLDRHLRAACSAGYARGAVGDLQIPDGDGDRLDILPARYSAALCSHRHAQHR